MEVSTGSKFAQASQAPEVAYLPTAGLQPVKNSARRGRLPRGVALIRKPAAAAAAPAERVAQSMTDPIEAVRQMLASMQAPLNFAVAVIAEYEKAHRRAG
ncbi:hypothetical protein [Achromobacter ruhlandii]|uniref:hypothetical protein n=1 Tax=Achromobacter ruhlandii TaxID=72557 RepID=UPI0012FE08C2|nr:hypothetical protein [Achromobacter ruhlandii]